MKSNWIPLAKIQELITLEPGLVLIGLGLGAWLIYKVFLREISPERHRNLQNLFRNLAYHLLSGITLFLTYYGLSHTEPTPPVERLMAYVGFATVIEGMVIFVKSARILLFEYLFLLHMRVAVPLLLVNLFTLILSLVLAGWTATELFNVKLTSLLATSAILSLVLGLALQDTLGNLFAGVALQFDKPYELGDWVEVQNGGQKWIGMVYEISWRATVLLGFGDETITISNRIMGQSEISNFSAKNRPFVRSLAFRLPYGTPIAKAKEIILYSALATPGIRKDPLPLVNVSELGEHWMTFKLIYSIDSYGLQYILADKVLTVALEGLDRAGIKIASSRLLVQKES